MKMTEEKQLTQERFEEIRAYFGIQFALAYVYAIFFSALPIPAILQAMTVDVQSYIQKGLQNGTIDFTKNPDIVSNTETMGKDLAKSLNLVAEYNHARLMAMNWTAPEEISHA